ncbi:MAG: hypothetical protein QW711_02815 [Candidatus Korarchaeum sp.]
MNMRKLSFVSQEDADSTLPKAFLIGTFRSSSTWEREALPKALDESLKYNEEIRGKGGKIDFIRAKKEARKILTS